MPFKFFRSKLSSSVFGAPEPDMMVTEQALPSDSQAALTCREELLRVCAAGDLPRLEQLFDFLQIRRGHPEIVGPYILPFPPSDPPFTWEMFEAAVREQHVPMITYLLNIFPTAKIRSNILVSGMSHRSIPIFSLLLSHDRSILDLEFETGATILSSAVWGSDPGLALYLLEEGADPNLGGFGPLSTLCVAVRGQPLVVIRRLVERGANLHKSFVLQCAAGTGRVDVVEYLLDAGAEVDDRGPSNYHGLPDDTALHYAVQDGHAGVVTLLIDRGADV